MISKIWQVGKIFLEVNFIIGLILIEVPTSRLAKIFIDFNFIAIFVQFNILGATKDLLILGYNSNGAELAPSAYHFKVIIVDKARVCIFITVEPITNIIDATIVQISLISIYLRRNSSTKAREYTKGFLRNWNYFGIALIHIKK